MSISRNIFNGDFSFTLRDASGAVLEEKNVTIANCGHDKINGANIAANIGDFDNGVLDNVWTISGDHQFHWDGFFRDGLLIHNPLISHTHHVMLTQTQPGEVYMAMIYAKGKF